MNDVSVKVCGKEYHLLFNGYAMFAAQEVFGDKNPSDVVYENTADGFVDLCRVFCILAEQGELSRRYEGHDKSEVPDEGMLRVKTAPYDVIAMRQGVISAITNGYKREIVEDETDLGLAELQKKRTKNRAKHTTSEPEQ